MATQLDIKLYQIQHYFFFQRTSNFNFGSDENYPLITTKNSDFTKNALLPAKRVVYDSYSTNIPVSSISPCGGEGAKSWGGERGKGGGGSASLDLILSFQDFSSSFATDKMIVDDGSVYIASYKTPKV